MEGDPSSFEGGRPLRREDRPGSLDAYMESLYSGSKRNRNTASLLSGLTNVRPLDKRVKRVAFEAAVRAPHAGSVPKAFGTARDKDIVMEELRAVMENRKSLRLSTGKRRAVPVREVSMLRSGDVEVTMSGYEHDEL